MRAILSSNPVSVCTRSPQSLPFEHHEWVLTAELIVLNRLPHQSNPYLDLATTVVTPIKEGRKEGRKRKEEKIARESANEIERGRHRRRSLRTVDVVS